MRFMEFAKAFTGKDSTALHSRLPLQLIPRSMLTLRALPYLGDFVGVGKLVEAVEAATPKSIARLEDR